tara:strand:- start:3386 stop:3658 length:273 start_codon:yes stop_codon:yes gene_type:complete
MKTIQVLHTRLKWILLYRDLKQREVLDLMPKPPVTRYVLTELCNGVRANPTMDTLTKVASALSVEIGDLLPVTEKISKRQFNKWVNDQEK